MKLIIRNKSCISEKSRKNGFQKGFLILLNEPMFKYESGIVVWPWNDKSDVVEDHTTTDFLSYWSNSDWTRTRLRLKISIVSTACCMPHYTKPVNIATTSWLRKHGNFLFLYLHSWLFMHHATDGKCLSVTIYLYLYFVLYGSITWCNSVHIFLNIYKFQHPYLIKCMFSFF